MLRKNRLKCESISARLFLACHQKFNAFKCKQFCCAKPTLAHLLAGGFPLYPRERRAAVHSLCYSVGSSAHSPANALELGRVRARAACCASRSLAISVGLFNTAARLLETCSTGFIKSLALPFRSAVFDNLQRQTLHCRVRRLDTSTAAAPQHPPSVSLPAADKSTLSGETP